MDRKQKNLIVGALLGAALGALGGYLFSRSLEALPDGERSMDLSRRQIPAGEVVRLVISTLGVLRGVAELGERV